MKGKTDHQYHHESMYKGAPPESFVKAELLRKNMTDAEKLLWEELKGNTLGVKFRRQHPIHFFIVDFYCHLLRLVIEIDGPYHLPEDQKQKDQERTGLLRFQDLEVIRFLNEEVLQNPGKVINNIQDKIAELKIARGGK